MSPLNPLGKRLISALFAVVFLFSTAHLLGWKGLYVLTGLVILACLIEFSQFLRPELDSSKSHIFLFVLLGTGIFTSSYFSEDFILPAFWGASLLTVIYLLLRIRSAESRKLTFHSQCLSILGFFYCGILPSLFAQILKFENGRGWFLTLLAIVFFGDSLAYFFGRYLGKKKLFPLISPKKTWMGAIGGIVGSVVFGTLFAAAYLDVPTWKILTISVLCGAFGQIGDLFESLVKRVAEIKDSGKLMPGHGGMLDRIDGVLFAGPVFYYLVKYL